MSVETPEGVLTFWTQDLTESDWYATSTDLDALITARFRETWEAAARGSLEHWRDCANGTLAYILVTDQFSRNMFRDDPRAFSTDPLALCAAKRGIAHGFDRRIAEPARQFCYMPLVHSEITSDQERGVRMMLDRMPESGESNLLHARAHREVIRRYGRFPHRNDVLGRNTTALEQVYLEDGAYGGIVRQLQAA